MCLRSTLALCVTATAITTLFSAAGHADYYEYEQGHARHAGEYHDYGRAMKRPRVHLGPRPYFLVKGMTESRLKQKLMSCKNQRARKSDFSIGHRGAPVQFPEHTKESYEAAARMGAGIIECDVTFTKDAELVCRHSQCDLHTTTDILEIPELAAKCTRDFVPATFNSDGSIATPASAKCCTSDLYLDEYKMLQGKMDGANPAATTREEYMKGTADWRTDLYDSRGTLLTHKESIELIRKLGSKFIPELKGTDGEIGFGESGLTQETYAQKMIDEYKYAGIPAWKVWAQSFNLDDVLYWILNEPQFGRQAVFLDDRYGGQIDPNHGDPTDFDPTMKELADLGVQIIAPPLYFLLEVLDDGSIVPSPYAQAARKAGLDIIAWTFERSDLRNGSRTGSIGDDGRPNATFYYQFDRNPAVQTINTDSDMYKALHVLAQHVGILGIFSDWPATVTYYANCFGLK